MAGQGQRLNVVPTVTVMGMIKARLAAATRGHALLKKKSDALTVQFRAILKKIVATKESMGEAMRASSFSLAEAKYVAGDGVRLSPELWGGRTVLRPWTELSNDPSWISDIRGLPLRPPAGNDYDLDVCAKPLQISCVLDDEMIRLWTMQACR